MVEETPTHVTLASGDKMPMVGFGLWKIPQDQAADAAYNAIKVGYRLLDSAACYANEVQVGQGIKRAIDEGIVTRADLFITTKLWGTFHRPEHVEPALQRSLDDLGLDYVDLYHIHWPIAVKYVPFDVKYPADWPNPETGVMEPDYGVSYHQTYAAMEAVHKKGLIRNIGVSNVQTNMIHQILTYAEIKPACLQVELHPYLQ